MMHSNVLGNRDPSPWSSLKRKGKCVRNHGDGGRRSQRKASKAGEKVSLILDHLLLCRATLAPCVVECGVWRGKEPLFCCVCVFVCLPLPFSLHVLHVHIISLLLSYIFLVLNVKLIDLNQK